MGAAGRSRSVGGKAFGAALWDPQAAPPAGLTGPDGAPAPKRFNIYRNNVIVSLCEALRQTFPALSSLLGEDYFNALARAFIAQHPPASPVLIWYGQDFAAFIDGFEPLKAYPYLADVARLEWAWLQSYHAADAAPLDPAVLGQVDPARLGGVRFAAHPATAVVVSPWPVLDLARANRFAPEDASVPDLDRPQSVLVTRPDLEVGLHLLPPGGGLFVTALLEGAMLGEAATQAVAHTATFSLSGCLSDCLSKGVFKGLLFD